jgi:D-glycero-beta-D-manno-heptose-7-phosphate kinase
MITISKERLHELQNKFNGKNIAVVGDLMLDCYFRGTVKRISPEAPVPVIEVDNEFYRFGGAANVALNLVKLGAHPFPLGVVGKDNYSDIFRNLLAEANITAECLITDENRPTTAKTRVIAHHQHVVRIDKESTESISPEIENTIIKNLEDRISKLDGIILQDYNKGVLTASLIEKVIELANKHNILITVDPKFNNFFSYKNVTVFKPNRKEAEDVLGMRIKTSEDIDKAGKSLLKELNAKYILLTLGEDGIAVFESNGNSKRMPTKARKVSDVSGAGDTVISTLTMALASGANIYEASFLANYAAGIVCEEVGIVPIEQNKLFEIVEQVI